MRKLGLAKDEHGLTRMAQTKIRNPFKKDLSEFIPDHLWQVDLLFLIFAGRRTIDAKPTEV